MLSDPQSVTLNSNPVSLPRTEMGPKSCTYTSADENVKLTISHQISGKTSRHLIRLDHRKVAPDPFQSNLNAEYKMAAYLVVVDPDIGYTPAEVLDVVKGLLTAASASTYSLVTRVIANES